jgi:prepilin-type N-terminal cleavage/methylation domain-containing protein
MTDTSSRRSGTTLIELLVVLAILATLAGVAALAIRRDSPADPTNAWVQIATVRRRALTAGVETTIVVLHAGVPLSVALYPDGRTLADPALSLDPLTGRRIDAAH